MSNAGQMTTQIAQFDARDEVTDAMTELVVRYVSETGLLTLADLRMALEVAIDLADELTPELTEDPAAVAALDDAIATIAGDAVEASTPR